MNRERVNVVVCHPERGPTRIAANVTAIYDSTVPIADVEKAIKAASRKAILAARETSAASVPTFSPVYGEQLAVPGT